jgi:hypothetical protein
MNITLFVEQLVGLYLLIAGTALVIRRRELHAVVADFQRSPALIMMGGMFALLFGLGVVLTHNLWAWEPGLIVTILGWFALVKGSFLLIWPKVWMSLAPKNPQSLARFVGVEGVVLQLLAASVLWGAYAARM